MAKVSVSSEIGALKRVIVHRPDEGIARISPKRAEELLFDDIVYLPQMQEEHDVFTEVLAHFLGAGNVLEIEQLLYEALEADEGDKLEMIAKIIDYEELPQSYGDLLIPLDNRALTETLVTGYLAEKDLILFDPIPNFIFTRDIAVTVNGHVIITKAAKEARFRENFLTRFIFWAHPIFRELGKAGRIINLNNVEHFPPSPKREMVSIEGGDVMIINQDYLLIGCSERTTAHAIRSLRDVLFEKGVVKHVVQVNIPTDRSYMHIDTIFTQINHHHVVAFKPIVLDGLGSYVEVFAQSGATRQYPSIKEFFLSEISPNMTFILSGEGESPYQDREQWTDGCNLVAIKPGVALTYDRNPYTEKAFRKAGYQIIHAHTLLQAFKDGSLKPEEVENTIITLPSNELSRARGGSHCMTCPIERG
ncbi:arginine deiminase family protein [Phaeodactylibacter luteus]|uniref:arginine deiminase n=1 Tax=Phaeodactylibacter luteus TaxID=1564516 RepID=A0A5C6RK58_9BACT|nr:arginine deiminase family protein [Phaeodactylibacter luteus]TXB62354.1 arginine deiminase [Phaeodactylibacter luteus]